MEKNEYLCNMNKAEEQQFAILSSRVSSAEREKHEAQKKIKLLEQKNSILESEKADVQRRLDEKMDEVSATVRQLAQFMMGKGAVTLSASLRDAIVAGVREEFEEKLREEREAHAKELQALKDFFALQLAAKDNEIAALKAKNGDNHGASPGTTNPGQPIPLGMAAEDRIKQLEQQKNRVAVDAYGQGTESEKYNHGCQNPVNADGLDLEGADVPDERLVEIAMKVKEGIQQRKGILVATFVEFPPIETRVLGEIAGKSSCPMRYVGTSPLQAVFELGAAPAEKMAEKIAELFRGFEDITLTPPKAEPSNPLFQDTNILN